MSRWLWAWWPCHDNSKLPSSHADFPKTIPGPIPPWTAHHTTRHLFGCLRCFENAGNCSTLTALSRVANCRSAVVRSNGVGNFVGHKSRTSSCNTVHFCRGVLSRCSSLTFKPAKEYSSFQMAFVEYLEAMSFQSHLPPKIASL